MLLLGFFLVVNLAQAQKRIKVEMEDQPKWHTITPEQEEASAVLIKNHTKLRYYYRKNKDLAQSRIVHRIVRLNDEKAIENFNTLRIPYSDQFDVKNFEGRTIKSDGSVTKVKQTSIEEGTMENGLNVKLIAFDNVAIGDEIEYYYEWNYPVNEGNSEVLSTGLPTVSTYFEAEFPTGSQYDVKGYNGVEFYELEAKDAFYIYVELRDQKGYEEEQFSTPDKYLPRLEYLLKPKSDHKPWFSWTAYGKEVGQKYFGDYRKDKRVLKKISQKIDLGDDAKENIFSIEDYLKKEYALIEDASPEKRDLQDIVASSRIYEDELIRLFAELTSFNEIPYSLGFTANRAVKEFDKDFANYENADLVFFYFPQFDMYMAPSFMVYRAPMIPVVMRSNGSVQYEIAPQWSNIEALKPRIVEVPNTPVKMSFHNHDVGVKLDVDHGQALVHTVQELNGESRIGIAPYYTLLSKEDAAEFSKNLIAFDPELDSIKELNTSNTQWADVHHNRPLIIESDVEAKSMMEALGTDEFLLKIGFVIGRQSELPDNEDRHFDVDFESAHSLTRNIELDIPEGYEVVNMEDANMEKELKRNGKVSCYFRSKARMESSKLIIEVDESYDDVFYTKEEFPVFREVINAAADFYQLTLLLKKKS